MHYDKTRDYGFELYGTANYDFYHKTGLGENNGGRRDADDLTPLPGNSKRINEIGTGDSWLLRYDRSVTKDAAKFLENRKADDKPFFFMTGYLAPHFPLIVPEEYWEKYRGKIPLPELPPNNDENLPLNYKHLQTAFNIEGLDPEITTKAREIYYGLTNWFDGQIGELLDAFEENTEVKDNTIIIYTSDHGESMGEHGLWWKNTMYDCSSKVPLIVSWPKKWKGNQRRTEVCSLLDVVQTINDIGQAKTPDDWDGDSLLPLLNDPSANWDNEVICEYYGHNVASGYTMLRKDNFKYVYHTSPKKGYPEVFELYDVKSDPKELKNLANDTAYQSIKEKLHKRLMEKLTEHPNESEKRCRADYIKGYNRTGFKNPNPFA